MIQARTFFARQRSVLIAYGAAAALFAVTSLFNPGFAGPVHLRFLLLTASFLGIVALGQTFVILAGGIDLSVPWAITASATLLTYWTNGQDAALPRVVPILIVLAIALGLFNGIGVGVIHVSPIIMTLCTNVILEGALLMVIGGQQASNPPPSVVAFATASLGPIPYGLAIWLVLGLLATVVLTRSAFGRRLYAVGTSLTVSEFSGVNVAATRIATYVISALCAALAGVLLVGFVGQSYFGLGDEYLFGSVAAVAIGGASILGGRGNYVGTIAGALALTFLNGMLPILNLQTGWLLIIYGLAILLTAGLATAGRRAA